MTKSLKVTETPDLQYPLTSELLGKAIKAKRTQSGLKLEDAAALAGVAKQTLMNIEHGDSKTQFKNVLAVCHSLGIQLRILPWQDEVIDEW